MNREKADGPKRRAAVGKLAAAILLMAVIGVSVTGCRGKQELVISSNAFGTETGTAALQDEPEAEDAEEGRDEAGDNAADRTEDQEEDAESESMSENTVVFVYICGQVMKPGVYELPEGSRICDAVECACGFTGDAAQEARNMAELLYDGEMIYIPTVEEAKEQELNFGESQGLSSGQSTSDSKASDSKAFDPNASDPNASGDKSSDGKININTASKETLTILPGIGEGKADSIIKYREKNGDFKTAEDIVLVSGIGPSLYDNLKDMITVK